MKSYYIVFQGNRIVYRGEDRTLAQMVLSKRDKAIFVDATLPFKATSEDSWLSFMCFSAHDSYEKQRYAQARKILIDESVAYVDRVLHGDKRSVSPLRIKRDDTVKLKKSSRYGGLYNTWDKGIVIGVSRDSDMIEILTLVESKEVKIKEFIDYLEKVQ